MAWPPKVVATFSSLFGDAETVHTAMPPFSLGGDLVDVAEFRRDDGTVIYATAGLSEDGGWSAKELVLHAESPDPRWADLLARVGGSTRHREYQHGGTLPLDGGDLSADGLGFFYAGRHVQVDEARVSLLQVITLTQDEIEVARRDSLYAVEAAWWKDGFGRMCRDGRPTSPSITTMPDVRPPATELSDLGWDAREVIEISIQCDHDGAESIRGHFGADEAALLSKLMVDRLPHPDQLSCFLHALMDFSVPEMAPVCLRVLQLSPNDHGAPQSYADALAILAAIEGGSWDTYFEYESDFERCCREAEQRRKDAGVEVIFAKPNNVFVNP